VNASLWVGALVSLAGVAFGGAISFALSRQQLRDARAQRIEDDLRASRRRNEDRRFAAYSDFLTRARTYRDANAIGSAPYDGYVDFFKLT
jgi:hypothetical protein